MSNLDNEANFLTVRSRESDIESKDREAFAFAYEPYIDVINGARFGIGEFGKPFSSGGTCESALNSAGS